MFFQGMIFYFLFCFRSFSAKKMPIFELCYCCAASGRYIETS